MSEINKTTSVIDTPRLKNEEDWFGIDPYQKGLIQFIEHSETPITIALQGEWGSGKTSLMNVLDRDLCAEEGSFHKIWLNTWEHSLMKTAESSLIGIIAALIEKVTSILGKEEERKEIAKKFFKVAKSMATNFAATQANKVMDSSGDILSEAFTSSSESTIGSLRDDLEKIIGKCVNEKDKKGVVFFIDDLDRIDPPVAVQLLELLKNIFSLNHCIFILAIDYDVVVKGLEPKFGKLCETNEREFRSFFDKIIQLPFSMPVSGYKIDKFLMSSLQSIGYLNKAESEKKEIKDFIGRTAGYTVGNNPRSLKRLVNSLSLIGCINHAKPQDPNQEVSKNTELDLLVNFALVSLQVAYPKIYRMVAKIPEFDKWDDKTATEFNLKKLTDEKITKLKAYNEFDEAWELVLFQACENDSYLKTRALYISRMMNDLKSLIGKEEQIGEVISEIISQSAITSVQVFDKPAEDYHQGQFAKLVMKAMIDRLKIKLPELKSTIEQQGQRVQTNALIKLTEQDWEHFFKISSRPQDGKIRLQIETEVCLVELSKNVADAKKQLTDRGSWETYENLADRYKKLFTGRVYVKCEDEPELYVNSSHGVYLHMSLSVYILNTEYFKGAEDIQEELATILTDIHKLRLDFGKIQILYTN